MKAKDEVLGHLGKVLTAELTAGHQYLLDAALCANWGYARLHHTLHERALEEVGHAAGVMNHILYLEGSPDVHRLDPVNTTATVLDLIKNELALEVEDLAILREAITHCATVGDFTSRKKLEDMITDTEEHIDWAETQLRTIQQVGIERYLSEQIKKSE
jgi:bacterioferritin